MFKVMLADDENRILKFLQTSIPWTQLGLEVAATATDGNEALRLAQEECVDIVVTDIRMPGLDGLELCQSLHEINPNIQIIIVSGYADFDYAKRAIQLQVLGYCLKPIIENEMIAFLRIAVKNIRKETTLNGDSLLDSIEEGNEHQIAEIFEELGVVAPRYYIAVSVRVHNIAKQLGAELTLKLGKHKYLYFSSRPLNRKAANELICYTGEKGGIGIWPAAVAPSQLKDAISDTTIMAYQFFISSTPTVCEKLVEGPLTDDLFSQMKQALIAPEQLKAFLEKLQTANCSMLFNLRSAFRFYNYIYSSKLLGTILEGEEYYLYGYEQLAVEYGCFEDILSEMLNTLCVPPMRETQDASSASSFMKIIKYLNENYEKDISLKKLSELFHMNSSYVSQLVKNETGLTYSQYLTELRIGKAKQLLQTTNLSLNEISEAVGFNDYFYFIKKFKKVVGVTPGRFNGSL
ncbi:response regulator [Hydrogenoanaerobacterium sp.]|uniref:response regulator transcription factor n=1 Tax=Hydrogenoanaerobacterium sp. TaxID=2953763 RepID=UPI00289DBB15|nr:response regulator [Hydrogenoanaerobacterium sp.]